MFDRTGNLVAPLRIHVATAALLLAMMAGGSAARRAAKTRIAAAILARHPDPGAAAAAKRACTTADVFVRSACARGQSGPAQRNRQDVRQAADAEGHTGT